jgi:hypothetical protein
MIAKRSLLRILAAADLGDSEDVAMRAALYIALSGSKQDFEALLRPAYCPQAAI